MIRTTAVAAVATLGVFAPAAIAAKPPPKNQATTISTLDAQPNPQVFGLTTALSGRLSGANASRTVVRLEADTTAPFGDGYTEVARVTSDPSGRFRFTPKPAVNTQYRAVAQTTPTVTSLGRLVLVRTNVGLLASTQAPRSGASVRFSGTVRPPKDGRLALIQRRSPTGVWVTVARTKLLDAGNTWSRYARRVTIRRSGSYRVKVASDTQHTNGYSRTVTITVR